MQMGKLRITQVVKNAAFCNDNQKVTLIHGKMQDFCIALKMTGRYGNFCIPRVIKIFTQLSDSNGQDCLFLYFTFIFTDLTDIIIILFIGQAVQEQKARHTHTQSRRCILYFQNFLVTFSFRGDDCQLLKTEEELRSASLSLGELLKKKAEDGVRVLIMIWGETTSIMGTHDTETENFFKGKTSILLSSLFKRV